MLASSVITDLNLRGFLCAVSLLCLPGCTSAVALTDPKVDPYENINRNVFTFNKQVDSYFFKPIATTYKTITPELVQTGVGNFFSNLKDVNVVLNDVLQGKFEQGVQDTGRLLINTTVGFGGLLDVATKSGLKRHEEDFEQTLATWGVPQGPYLVFPVLGPSTTRGIPGAVVDTAANPATYIGVPIRILEMVHLRAQADTSLKTIDEAALDPYVFTREAYLQYRKNLITDGKSEFADDLLDNDDALDSDESAKKLHAKLELPEFKQAANTLGNTEQSFASAEHTFNKTSDLIDDLEELKAHKSKRRHHKRKSTKH